MLKVYCFFVLLIGASLANDNCFTEFKNQLSFDGKCARAKTQLALTGETLYMTFNEIGSFRTDYSLQSAFDFGGCLIGSIFESYRDFNRGRRRHHRFSPWMSYRWLPPFSVQISSRGFRVKGYTEDFGYNDLEHPCKPTFDTDGNLKIIDINIDMGLAVGLFKIKFGDGINIYKAPAPIEYAYIATKVVIGVLAVFIFIAISVIGGGIFFYFYRKQSKSNIEAQELPQIAVKVENASPKQKKTRDEATKSETSL